jgi:hypothetical protein
VTNYDIIGDIHGQFQKLEGLLHHLGYQEVDGAFRKEGHTAVFVGDLIDRGSGQLKVLQTVKAMVDAESALCVMGNHEFNALAYSTLKNPKDPAGKVDFCRPHTAKNRHQHEAFLALDPPLRDEWLQWFRSLPLWLDLPDLRVVHACWHEPSMEIVKEELGGAHFTSNDQIRSASDKDHPLYLAVEILLKGPEIDLESLGLPEFLDKGDVKRSNARITWWLEHHQESLHLFQGAGAIQLDAEQFNVVTKAMAPYAYSGQQPLFFGHYWQEHSDEMRHATYGKNAACVDFSAGKTGELTAYRYKVGQKIALEHYDKVPKRS